MSQTATQFDPRTITDLTTLIDARQQYKPAALRAAKAFAKSKPWRGNVDERKEKFETLHAALIVAYELPHTLSFGEIDPLRTAAGSQFRIDDRRRFMKLHWKLSVITYLVGFGTLRGFNAEQSYKWALTLFKRCFPISFSKLEMRSGWIVKRAG